MLLGWYCDLGYIDDSEKKINSEGPYPKFSDIVFIEKKRPFVIPVVKTPVSEGYTTVVKTDDISEYFSVGESFFGTGIYATYLVNEGLIGSGFENFTELVLPGWNKSWPKFNEFYANPGDSSNWRAEHVPVVYFPSLNRILADAANWLMFKLDEGNNWIPIKASGRSYTNNGRVYTTFPRTTPIFSSGTGSNFIVLNAPYDGYSSLKILKNFANSSVYSLEQGFSDYLKYNIRINSNKEGGEAWNWDLLFTDSSNQGPDFETEEPPDPGPEPGPVDPDNPYGPIPPSGPTDPKVDPPGTFDGKSDPIPDSSLPTLSAANTGFTRIYNPTLEQVQDLARYLWTDETVIQTIWNHIKQYFENPMEAIIGFNLVPVPVPNGGTKNFALMYIDTGVSMTYAANQFVDLDCGTAKVERFYGSALDQAPNTKVSCFLPFIGIVQLNTDEVMNTNLQVKYRVDIVTGSCVAKILVDGNVLYQYSGHCAINIPISAADFSSYVSAAISIAKLGIAAGVGGIEGAMMSASSDPIQETNKVTKTTRTDTKTERNPSTGRQITSGTRTIVNVKEEKEEISATGASFSGLSPTNVANTVGQIMGSKPFINHSGSFSGNSGYLGIRRPYLIIERPNLCMPANFQHYNGFPSMITISLGSCTGYTKIQQVQLTGVSATNPEQAEILSLLKSGVIF